MPVAVDVDTGNANGFTVGLPRFWGSFHDDANFYRLLPVTQG
ncbi:hypothetical protein [uncultured Tateyamaria sp.]|nr:hypothetical protein [uncultured Tateyamaria sp.]